MYTREVLSNGLRIIAHQMSSMKSLALGIWINTGGRYESSKDKGISHFLEHLVFKGTKKFSCRRLKESIEGIGGSLNGFTSEELTCYLVKIPAEYQKLALTVLSEMALHPSLPLKDIKKEKQVILEEIKMYRDLPQSYVYELLDELIWPAHPLGRPIIGTAESVSALSRSRIKEYKEQYYSGMNMVIAAAGNLDALQLIEDTKNNFSALKKGKKNLFIPTKKTQKIPQLMIFNKETEQTHLALGFQSLPRQHRLKHSLGLLHIILGANMSSRLFNQLREKRGLAYEIGTALKLFYDTGAFIVHAGIDNQKVPEAITLILKELKKVKNNPVSEGEFKRAKEFYLGHLKLALEDTLEHMFWIGEATATLDRTYSLERVVSEVSSVSKKDIKKVAELIFSDDKLNLALIGPVEHLKNDIHSRLSLE